MSKTIEFQSAFIAVVPRNYMQNSILGREIVSIRFHRSLVPQHFGLWLRLWSRSFGFQ